MTYYNDDKLPFYVDGKVVCLTEEEAEWLQDAGYQVEPVYREGDLFDGIREES